MIEYDNTELIKNIFKDLEKYGINETSTIYNISTTKGNSTDYTAQLKIKDLVEAIVNNLHKYPD